MSSDDNHWWAQLMPMAHNNIWTCDVFTTSSFNFGPQTYFVSHYCYGRALYAVFYRKFFLRSTAELLIVVWQMTCQRSHMFWCALCSHHVFVLLVQFCFGSFENFRLSGFARVWCRFPSRRQPYTSICLSTFFLSLMFAFIPLFVDFVCYLTFWHLTIQI